MGANLKKQTALSKYAPYDKELVEKNLRAARENFSHKIVVLDDDPTGIQTVHGIYVYTDWTIESIREGFLSEQQMFFILTNSRSFNEEQTKEVHETIAENIKVVAKETGLDYIVISRGDSTLRGHYPQETETLRLKLDQEDAPIDGEIIIPFFAEGGRYTIDNIHYVAQDDILVPAGQTEFAKDKTFGYQYSHLGRWVQEKTNGRYLEDHIAYISLDELRKLNYKAITDKLIGTQCFQKVIVNAISYEDVKVFVTALLHAYQAGKRFIYRSAAALTKVIGGISDKPLLSQEELIDENNNNGGLIIVGSHVKKTSDQLAKLRTRTDIQFIEFNQHLVVDDNAFRAEIERVITRTETNLFAGYTTAVYTRRDRLDFDKLTTLETSNTTLLYENLSEEKKKALELDLSVRISNAVTEIVKRLTIRPRFLIAKGGITSSEIGTTSLGVKKALVLGQILPGIPVWKTGEESKFPGMSYVIFPGNVGTVDDLLHAVEKMEWKEDEL